MAEYINKNKAILGGVIGALAIGAIVGVIGVVSNGFDGKTINDLLTKKYDYTQINLVNKYEEKKLTSETALEFLNYDYKVIGSVDVVNNVYLDAGGMLFDGTETTAVLTTTFAEDTTFTHIAITGHQYYEENYYDEDGQLVVDDDGNEVFQNYLCDKAKLVVNDFDPVTYITNNDNTKKTPKIETKKFEFEVSQTGLSLSVSEGRFVVTSIELWNIEVAEEEEEETTSSETNSTTTETSSATA